MQRLKDFFKLNKDKQKNFYHKLIELKSKTIHNDLKNIQNQMSDNSVLLDDIMKKIDEINSTEESFSCVNQKLQRSIEAITKNNLETVKNVEDVSNKFTNVLNVTELIEQITMEINILSLNASIEAAGAGERGKGFAAVADQIQELGKKTKEAAKKIQDSIKAMADELDVTATKVEITRTSINNLMDINSEYKDINNILFDDSKEMRDMVENIALHSFISLAKIDHVVFKANAYKHVVTKELYESVTHEHCRLGRWYYQGYGDKYYHGNPYYKKLERPHELVHTYSSEISELIKLKPANPVVYLEKLSLMEEESEKIFKILDNLIEY